MENHKLRRIRFVISLLILLLIVGAFIWRNTARRPPSKVAKIVGNGIIEATEVDVSAKVAGKVQELLVDEGNDLRPGQLIATLDSAELQGQVEAARGNLQAAEANYAELRAGTRPEDIRRAQAQYNAAQDLLRQSEANLSLVKAGPRKEEIEQLRSALRQSEVTLAEAQTEFTRTEKLYKDGAVAQQRVDQLKAQRDIAQTAVDAAQQRLAAAITGARPQEVEQAEAAVARAQSQVNDARAGLDLVLAGPRKETIDAAKARVEQAQGALNTAESTLAQTKIYAPSAGRVTLRNVEPGELVTPGLPIVRYADLTSMWIRVYVPEEQIGLVKIGQTAKVATDAFPTRQFNGKVTEIAQEPEFTPKNVQTKEERVKLVYAIKVKLENPDGLLKPGMPGDAVIDVK